MEGSPDSSCSSMRCGGASASFVNRPLPSFAQDPVPVAVAHVPVRRVRAVHGRDAVPARLLACNPAVPVVVVASEGAEARRRRGSGLARPRRRFRASGKLHLQAVASGDNPFKCRGLPAVDGEAVGTLDLKDATGEPAPVPVREPLACVLAGFLVAVHLRRGEREVPEVLREALPGRPVPRA